MLPLLLALAARADAPEAPPPDAPAEAPVEAPAKPKTELGISGVYTIWGLTQRNFLLGKEHPLDDAAYTVQMLRTKFEAKRGKVGVTARFDAAQGWWGVDNDPNAAENPTLDEEGNLVPGSTYNADKLFGRKDANYAVHFDLAYLWAELDAGVPIRLQAGRQPFTAGNLLVLDEDLDGVVLSAKPAERLGVELSWAKYSEGRGAITLPTGNVMSDADDYSDADLFGAAARYEQEDLKAEVFGYYYRDTIADDWAHLPNGLGYVRSRFSPHVTDLVAVGVAGSGELAVAEGLAWKVEGDFLTGRDGVANTGHEGGLVDVNDGRLIGWNAYADLTQKLKPGVPLDLGLTFGMGSGDPDPTGGAGNVNRISTMGFFPLTNVWEDSVMPDVEGISPQGLGSPVSRGYRELENTTALVGRVGVEPVKGLRLEGAGAWLLATRPVWGFDSAGNPVATGDRDLGVELDANAIVTLKNGLQLKSLFGWFLPGSAAGNLINGDDALLEPAWELKNEAIVKF